MGEQEHIQKSHREQNSRQQIARERHQIRSAIIKVLENAMIANETLKRTRPAPVLGPYKARINELLVQAEYGRRGLTASIIFMTLWHEGYRGSISGVQNYIWRQRKTVQEVENTIRRIRHWRRFFAADQATIPFTDEATIGRILLLIRAEKEWLSKMNK